MTSKLSKIPQELKDRKQWIVWKHADAVFGVKPKKVPFTVGFKRRASSTDPSAWSTFEEVADTEMTSDQGIGYVFNGEYIGIDIDYKDTGVPTEWHKKIVSGLASYTEMSPSGKGVHIFVKGNLAGRSGLNTPQVEIYDKGRYFTFTGKAHSKFASIRDCAEMVHRLYDNVRRSQEGNGGVSSSAPQVVQKVYTGGRSSFLAQRIGGLRRQGLPSNSILGVLRELNVTHCNPPLPDAELQATVLKSATKWRSEEDKFRYTDDGNAQRMHHRFHDVLKYCRQWKKWLFWDTLKWSVDADYVERSLLGEVMKDMYQEAVQATLEEDDTKRKALLKWLRTCDGQRRRMETLKAAEQYFAVKAEVFDNQPMLLNCGNGSIELETGKVRPARKDDLLTWNIATEYDPEAKCPTWDAFIEKVLPDEDVQAFVQDAVGYSLSGSVSEQCLFFLHGEGANGKSTFVEVLLALMGEYGQKASHKILFAGRAGGATPEVAGLKGKRFVAVQEVEQSKRMAAARLKDITGGDTITARHLYQEPITFQGTHKIWMCGNHKPTMVETDIGSWRRMRLIPFEVHIPIHAQDPQLKEKLLLELPGILAWAVRGSQRWVAGGLQPPAAVVEATEQYRSEEDIFATFADEALERHPGSRLSLDEMSAIWRTWCPSHREVPPDWGLKQLWTGLIRIGFTKKRRVTTADGKKLWYWLDVREIRQERFSALQADGTVSLKL